jgi:hypothetical protein
VETNKSICAQHASALARIVGSVPMIPEMSDAIQTRQSPPVSATAEVASSMGIDGATRDATAVKDKTSDDGVGEGFAVSAEDASGAELVPLHPLSARSTAAMAAAPTPDLFMSLPDLPRA